MTSADFSPAAVVVEGGPLEIRRVSVGPMDNNAYLLTCTASGAQLLVDAAADPDRLDALISEGSAEGRLDTIVTTHSHHDHVGALADVVERTGARTAAGAEDAPAIPVPTDVPLHHGDTVQVGEQRLDVIGLRGHTPGSIALAWTAPDGTTFLLTGDSLFPGGVGNTDHDPARFRSLLDDVEQRIFDRYPDSARVLPGHGDGTTLGAERPQLPQWRERGW